METAGDFDEATMEMLCANLPSSVFHSNTPDPRLQRAWQETERTNQVTPILKEELRLCILAKRHKKGEPEIDIRSEQPKKYELTEEEKRKKERRKEQNRRAAQKCRQKRKNKLQCETEIYEITRKKNQKLKDEVLKLNQQCNILEPFAKSLLFPQKYPFTHTVTPTVTSVTNVSSPSGSTSSLEGKSIFQFTGIGKPAQVTLAAECQVSVLSGSSAKLESECVLECNDTGFFQNFRTTSSALEIVPFVGPTDSSSPMSDAFDRLNLDVIPESAPELQRECSYEHQIRLDFYPQHDPLLTKPTSYLSDGDMDLASLTSSPGHRFDSLEAFPTNFPSPPVFPDSNQCSIELTIDQDPLNEHFGLGLFQDYKLDEDNLLGAVTSQQGDELEGVATSVIETDDIETDGVGMEKIVLSHGGVCNSETIYISQNTGSPEKIANTLAFKQLAGMDAYRAGQYYHSSPSSPLTPLSPPSPAYPFSADMNLDLTSQADRRHLVSPMETANIVRPAMRRSASTMSNTPSPYSGQQLTSSISPPPSVPSPESLGLPDSPPILRSKASSGGYFSPFSPLSPVLVTDLDSASGLSEFTEDDFYSTR